MPGLGPWVPGDHPVLAQAVLAQALPGDGVVLETASMSIRVYPREIRWRITQRWIIQRLITHRRIIQRSAIQRSVIQRSVIQRRIR